VTKIGNFERGEVKKSAHYLKIMQAFFDKPQPKFQVCSRNGFLRWVLNRMTMALEWFYGYLSQTPQPPCWRGGCPAGINATSASFLFLVRLSNLRRNPCVFGCTRI